MPASMRAAALVFLAAAGLAVAQPLQFPTANHALLEPGGEERFYVGTAGKPWTSGQFGCVRSDGRQFHEGLDIRCQQRDRRGEPTDPVSATADGVVAYVNTRPGLSNYGNYVVLRHFIEGLEVYSLYAHLSAVRGGLKAGDQVHAGEVIATMGRTSNTRQRITQDRAHCHFELDLAASDRYAAWHRSRLPEQRNDHGNFNGFNLIGFDPAAVLREQARLGAGFSLVRFLQSRPEMFRVALRGGNFPWARRYPALVQGNPVAQREGIAGYEVAFTFNGLPIRIVPRAASELKSPAKVTLLSVNEAEWNEHHCARLIFKRGQAWTLLAHGQQILDLLTY
jgi:peptidoglycan LD-endopeptidase LytH